MFVGYIQNTNGCRFSSGKKWFKISNRGTFGLDIDWVQPYNLPSIMDQKAASMIGM